MEQILNLKSRIWSRINYVKFTDIIPLASSSAVDDVERLMMNEDGDAIDQTPCQRVNNGSTNGPLSIDIHFP